MYSISDNCFLVSITGQDKVGIVSEVTNFLFDAGANLAECTYAIAEDTFEFSAIAEFSASMSLEELKGGLAALSLLTGARVTVSLFSFMPDDSDKAHVTHIVSIQGGDKPGLLARLSDVLVEYKANIIRLSSKRTQNGENKFSYETRFLVNAEASPLDALEAALYNTAGSLRLECKVEEV